MLAQELSHHKLDCLFNAPVTEWLKEQSPLSEDELQNLCIDMDDFKVLNNVLYNKANYYCIFVGVNL